MNRPTRQFAGRRKRFAHYLHVEQLESRRLLATFAVTNLDDIGLGSLRQAVLDANAAAGADEIVFQAGLTGTIQLTSGELTITDSVSINGPGPSEMAIDAGGLSRVAYIDDGLATYADVEINNLTITGGQANEGGGIRSFENLTLDDVGLTNNHATGPGANGGGIQHGSANRWHKHDRPSVDSFENLSDNSPMSPVFE